MNAGKPPTRRFAHTVVWAAAVSSDSVGEITGYQLEAQLVVMLATDRSPSSTGVVAKRPTMCVPTRHGTYVLRRVVRRSQMRNGQGHEVPT